MLVEKNLDLDLPTDPESASWDPELTNANVVDDVINVLVAPLPGVKYEGYGVNTIQGWILPARPIIRCAYRRSIAFVLKCPLAGANNVSLLLECDEAERHRAASVSGKRGIRVPGWCSGQLQPYFPQASLIER